MDIFFLCLNYFLQILLQQLPKISYISRIHIQTSIQLLTLFIVTVLFAHRGESFLIAVSPSEFYYIFSSILFPLKNTNMSAFEKMWMGWTWKPSSVFYRVIMTVHFVGWMGFNILQGFFYSSNIISSNCFTNSPKRKFQVLFQSFFFIAWSTAVFSYFWDMKRVRNIKQKKLQA